MCNCGDFFYTEEHPPPSCLEGWRHGYVQLKEVKIHFVETGGTDKPLMLLIHGFPEFWYAWRYQLRYFERTHHVVAIDMRGYNDSEKPEGLANYATSKLVADVVQIIQHFGGKAIVVCHDWGGIVSWLLAGYHPEVVDRLIVMNVPHPRAATFYILKSPRQWLRSWYLFWFVCPFLPEAVIRAKDYDFIVDMFRNKRAGILHPENFSDEDVEAWKHALSKPGAIHCPLNFYRALFFAEGALPYPSGKIRPKTLIIWGENDVALAPQLADESAKMCEDASVKKIPKASHWVQQDCPDLVNQYMEEFLYDDVELSDVVNRS